MAQQTYQIHPDLANELERRLNRFSGWFLAFAVSLTFWLLIFHLIGCTPTPENYPYVLGAIDE